MAWERRRQGLYYYRARRVGKKVIKQYIGQGPAAERAANEDAAQRAERASHRQEEKQRREEYEALECILAQANAEAAKAMEDAITSIGYYRHHREWRRRRDAKEESGK